MDKSVFDFSRPAADDAAAEHGALNVLVGSEGFSLHATDGAGDLRALKAWQFGAPGQNGSDTETNLRGIFGSEPLLSAHFDSVRYAIFNRNATLVPRRMFDAGNLPAYFKLLLPASEYEYRYDILPEFECFLVYAAPPAIFRMCGQYFSEGRPMHLATPLLKNWRDLVPARDYGVCANLRNQVVQVAVFDRQNLLFYNTFDFSKPVDMLYFVLMAYDQFRLDPENIPLLLSGSVEAGSEAHKLLERYIRTVHFAVPAAATGLPAEARAFPDHYWFDLFSIATTL